MSHVWVFYLEFLGIQEVCGDNLESTLMLHNCLTLKIIQVIVYQLMY